MTVRIELKGSEAMQSALQKASAEVREAAGKAVLATAVELRADIQNMISRKGTGVTYYRIPGDDGLMRIYAGNPDAYGPAKLVAAFKQDGKANLSRTHTASAPGAPPARDTGRYSNSIVFDVAGATTAVVFPKGDGMALLGQWLEYGTRKIAPRPHFRPAAERIKPKFLAALEAAIKGAMR